MLAVPALAACGPGQADGLTLDQLHVLGAALGDADQGDDADPPPLG